MSDNSDYSKMSNITKDLLFATSSTVNITRNFESLTFPSNTVNDENLQTLDLSNFSGLRSMVIGDSCFRNVNSLRAIGLQNLTSITVGSNSFTNQFHTLTLRALEDLEYYLSSNTGSFIIDDCPQFTTLSIGPYSFSEYTSFTASSRLLKSFRIDLPVMTELVFGSEDEISNNFFNASLTLNGIHLFSVQFLSAFVVNIGFR